LETRNRHSRAVGAAVILAGLVALLVLLPGAARAAEPGLPQPDYPADSCYDVSIDCGVAEFDSDVMTESWDAYERSSGTCRTRWARATRKNLVWMVVFRYYEQVRWCWKSGKITYFWRDRWPASTSFGWAFDGHIGSNCIYEHCSGRGVGTYSTDAWTQGGFHACLPQFCLYKYPIVDIWVHGDGGSGASASGA
jgi:hypothetical protein